MQSSKIHAKIFHKTTHKFIYLLFKFWWQQNIIHSQTSLQLRIAGLLKKPQHFTTDMVRSSNYITTWQTSRYNNNKNLREEICAIRNWCNRESTEFICMNLTPILNFEFHKHSNLTSHANKLRKTQSF